MPSWSSAIPGWTRDRATSVASYRLGYRNGHLGIAGSIYNGKRIFRGKKASKLWRGVDSRPAVDRHHTNRPSAKA